MTERYNELLSWWPAVAVPVLVVGIIVLVVQQASLSNQLVDLRRDLGGLATETVLLQQEVRQLRRAAEAAPAPAPRAKGKAKKKARATRGSGGR